MKKKFRLCLAVVVIFLFGLQIKPEMASAESDYVAELSIHAFYNSFSEQHVFLTIKNLTSSTLNFCDYPIKKSKKISVSIWPDSMGWGGVYINREMVVDSGIKVTTLSIKITEEEFNTIASKTPAESYYHDGLSNDLWHNCTTYSTKMWNLVAPDDKKISGSFAGVDAPKSVVKKMKAITGYTEACFTPGGTFSWADVFYVSKGKELVPRDIAAPTSLTCTEKTKSSVSLSWKINERKLLNNKKSITGYYIYYYNQKTPDSVTRVSSTSKTATISGLKSGTTYCFQVCGYYKSDNYETIGQKTTITITTSVKKSLKLNKSKASLYKGGTLQLKATKKGISGKVTWKSSNTRVATVNKNGKVKAKKAGTTYITAKAGKLTAKCKVVVKKNRLTLSSVKITLKQGQSKKITAKYNGKKCSPKWKASSGVVTVKNGTITGKKAGSATVTATYKKKKVTCKVTVKASSHRYEVIDESGTWAWAKAQCEKKGGHLVTITSAKEQAEVAKLVKQGKKHFYWMGCKKINGAYTKWITGETVSYTHYDTQNGEPNNYKGLENVLVMYRIANPLGGKSGALKWNDLRSDGECNGEAFFGASNSGYICEWD